ncbi:Late embryogenesis abundant protein [Thalictrum thalictroides]|uniref:Late embryogenesis abundant protein n=1 Tax=Thalictrum thalictroides TaxID=46969 RepID=A0A7J6WEK5_THATH|nr:Late embryogenesis abundant protein [Thalictrum thalictroides]
MEHHTRVPIEPLSATRPVKQHSHTHYYVRRVRGSLTNRFVKLICAIFLSILFVVGLLLFIIWISLRPHRPRFHIKSFSIPGLNQATGVQNAQVSFDVTARNPNQNIGIYYDAMDATVFYEDKSIGQTPLLFPFYQPKKNTTWIHGELSGATLTADSAKWQSFIDELSKGTVVFRLDLKSRIRFKVSNWWDSKNHRMHANCQITVGQDGQILPTSKDKRCPVYFS